MLNLLIINNGERELLIIISRMYSPFSYNEKKYVMGSCVLPANAEECKENISFIFQDRVFEIFEEFQTAIIIDNKNILQLEKPLEILRAGIIDNEPMLKTPWGDKRLADKAVNK